MPGSRTISVVIPVYNGQEFLGEAIDSVLTQTLPPDEILVFDNASTDATRAIATSRLSESAVKTFSENAGAAANMNRSFAAARGHYVLWLAADDRLHPEALEKCAAMLDLHPEAPACLPGILFVDRLGEPARTQVDTELASSDLATRLRSFLRRQRWTEFYCLYRRTAVAAAPPITMDYGADVLFTWWFLLRQPLLVTDELLLEYREYPKSQLEVAQSLDPRAPRRHWLMVGVWRRLYTMTRADDLSGRVKRTARRELILCLLTEHWVNHLLGDVTGRWPGLGPPVRFMIRVATQLVRLQRRIRSFVL